jgi:hypothetical protein
MTSPIQIIPVTAKYLQSKKYERRSGWNGDVNSVCEASGQNISRISENVFSFTEYNLLPVDGSELDGHYTFFVNYKTFAYCFYKSSDYGSLTYTLPSDNTDLISKYNDVTRAIVESIIATKLLGAYFYDQKDSWHQGASLIQPDGETNRYYKRSLITDYRGYLWTEMKPNVKDEHETTACKLIDKEYVEAVNPRVKLNFKERITRISKDRSNDVVFKDSVYIEHFIPFTFQADNGIMRELWLIYSDSTWSKNSMARNIGIAENLNIENEKILFGTDRCDFNFKKYIQLMPNIVQSRYF